MRLAAAEAAIAAVLPSGVHCAVSDPRAEATGLFPEEAEHIARAVAKRQREFAAGRRAARLALAAMGQVAAPILAAPSRAPLWPKGFVGSISHCDDLCFAICAPGSRFRAIGCDVEELAPMSDAVAEAVTSPRERAWLTANASYQPVHLFSAKEAIYKSLFAITGKMIGFKDLDILPEPSGGLCGTLLCSLFPFEAGARFPIVSAPLSGHVIHMSFIE